MNRVDNPYNVIEPGKRPRATLTPSMALKDGKPFLSFAVQGGDGQDQNLLQFFLNVVEFDMNVQQAAEAANINSYQMRGSFGEHESRPGHMTLTDSTPPWVRGESAARLRQRAEIMVRWLLIGSPPDRGRWRPLHNFCMYRPSLTSLFIDFG